MEEKGAEAIVRDTLFLGLPAISKHRITKRYRIPQLDEKINKHRFLQEIRCLAKCRKFGVHVPW
jgi:TP53 regulating kinase-like protein